MSSCILNLFITIIDHISLDDDELCRQQAFAINTENFATLDFVIHTRSTVSYETNYPGGAISFAAGWHLSYFMSQADIIRKVVSFSDLDQKNELMKLAGNRNSMLSDAILQHITHCMTAHVDLFRRQDETALGWRGIETVDPSRLPVVLPAGHEKAALELEIIQKLNND